MNTNIKEEIYCYAYKEDYVENTKDIELGKKESTIVYTILFVFAILFSLPILVENIILWSLISGFCIVTFLFNRREKNAYLKSLINIVIGLFYAGFIVACDLDIVSHIKFQISRKSELIITPILGFLIYDIGVIINIVRKKYSTKKQDGIKTKTTRNTRDYMGALLGTLIARLLSRNFGDTPALDWILILTSSILFVLSLVFLQKYLICKIFYNRRI